MAEDALDLLPGFRRRLIVTPGPGRVTAALEDDYHCMAVTLCHAEGWVTDVVAEMDRVPWTTCPGAPAVLTATFAGQALADVTARRDKKANCTHLHDLAVLAAAHAGDGAPFVYDILVCDAVDGVNRAEIRRDGVALVRLTHRDDVVVEPAALAGTSLFQLRDWIDSLEEPEREAARLLQWGTILAHGRAYPMDRQSDASRMPQNCYTFQPGQREHATRVGKVFDLSQGSVAPLDHFEDGVFKSRAITVAGGDQHQNRNRPGA